MLYVSEKIQRVREEENKKERSKKANLSISQSRNLLYKGQCNCAYWHGIFGGLYLPHLRYAVYKNLIEAENLIKSSTVYRSS